MGKVTRWFRGLLGINKGENNADNPNHGDRKEKKKYTLGNNGKDLGIVDQNPVNIPGGDDTWLRSYFARAEREQTKQAIAVAAAAAAARDAAVAAANAAAAVAKLTSQDRGILFGGRIEIWAAVLIQSAFRGYLARKAFRALKGLVKLQAMVKGFLVRKRANEILFHSLQALIRAQTVARSQRARRLINRENPGFHKGNQPRKFHESAARNSFDESREVVENYTISPRSKSRRRDTCLSQFVVDQTQITMPSPARLSMPESHRVEEFEWSFIVEDELKASTQSTPRFATSFRSNSPVTTPKSVYGDFSPRPCSNCPNYMSKTQSFRAKSRSQSAPKHRPEPGSRMKASLNEIMASTSSFTGVRMHRSCY